MLFCRFLICLIIIFTKMKKLFILAVAALALGSCSTIQNSASVAEVDNHILAGAVADLEVAPQRVTYTYKTKASVRRGGYKNCIRTAIREALTNNGNADVLVQEEITTTTRMGLFGSKLKTVTVSGYPAKYKNIKTISQSSLIKGLEAGGK